MELREFNKFFFPFAAVMLVGLDSIVLNVNLEWIASMELVRSTHSNANVSVNTTDLPVISQHAAKDVTQNM